jgi:hypothetical protein
MGDHADDTLAAIGEDWAGWGRPIPRAPTYRRPQREPKPVTCKFCGQSGLHWAYYEPAGNWLLMTATNEKHDCPVSLRRKNDRICDRCGEGELHWDKEPGSGKWRLFCRAGIMHKCNPTQRSSTP